MRILNYQETPAPDVDEPGTGHGAGTARVTVASDGYGELFGGSPVDVYAHAMVGSPGTLWVQWWWPAHEGAACCL